jgi:hypothetical protein
VEEEGFLIMDSWKSCASPISWHSSKLTSLSAGCGKTVLWYVAFQLLQQLEFILFTSSAIIENIKHMREDRLTLFAYYYFDFQDAAKRDLRGLLSSLLMQLSKCSVRCLDVLDQLYTTCRDGSEQPSEASLAECLKNMILTEHSPIYIIVDALDECPITARTPSPRKKVLDFLKDLVHWDQQHPNLRICISSRPEQDIQAALDPLTPPWCHVSLHQESGQMGDINNYIRSFVSSDEAMRTWSAEDKELVINTLSERAGGM